MKRTLLILSILTSVVLIGFVVRNTVRAQRRTHAVESIANSDPILGASFLYVPTLLVHGDRDQVVPLFQHSAVLAARMGSRCQLVTVAGDHGEPEAFRLDRVLAFLNAHKIHDTPLVLLHAWDRKAADWDACTRTLPSKTDRARVAFVSGLRKRCAIVEDDVLGNAWGNDAALARLEQVIGNHARVVLVGEDMGGILMLRYAEKHPDHVAAIIGIYPVCSTQTLYEAGQKAPSSSLTHTLSNDLLSAY